MGKTNKVAEIKKLQNGKIAVRWEGGKKFYMIEDDTIAQFVIFRMTRPNSETHTTDRATLISKR